MDAIIRLLEFHGHGARDVVDVCCVCLEGVLGSLDALVHVEIDVVGECDKFVVHHFG